MTDKQVYVPVAITIDTETGELSQAPYIDFDGAPWMFVDSEDNVWPVGLEDEDNNRILEWERDEATESAAIDLLAGLLSKWGDK